MAVGANRRTLEDLLEAGQARIERLDPAEAFAAIQRGALLIDIRSDREREGIIPGSLHIPRTVLEWRLGLAGSRVVVLERDVTVGDRVH